MFKFLKNIYNILAKSSKISINKPIVKEKTIDQSILEQFYQDEIKKDVIIYPDVINYQLEKRNIFLDVFYKELPERVIKEIPLLITKFNINNKYRLAHLLGQCSHESGFKENIRENLNYSVLGLKKFVDWGRITQAEALKYGRTENKPANKEKIANCIYGGEWGRENLGNTEYGDGFKFRGAGFLQTTGKNNFKELSKFINVDLINNPELLAKEYPLSSAGYFFYSRPKLLSACDKGINQETVLTITKIINGGKLGLKHREAETMKFFNIMSNFETKNNISLF